MRILGKLVSFICWSGCHSARLDGAVMSNTHVWKTRHGWRTSRTLRLAHGNAYIVSWWFCTIFRGSALAFYSSFLFFFLSQWHAKILPAEKQLADAKKVPGHPMAILQLIESSTAAEESVRQAAAIHFKNFIKKSWDEAHEVSQWKSYARHQRGFNDWTIGY